MSSEYTPIPDPQQTVEALQQAIMAIKQTIEVLLGQRGSGNSAVVTKADLASLNVPIKVQSYLKGNLPPPAQAAYVVYVPNEAGGAVLAFSDGTNWRRVTDRNVVS
jgi:hypothetical protein